MIFPWAECGFCGRTECGAPCQTLVPEFNQSSQAILITVIKQIPMVTGSFQNSRESVKRLKGNQSFTVIVSL